MSAFIAFSSIAVGFVMAAAEGFKPLPAVCPPGWLAWQDSCYILLTEQMDWFQASKLCDRPGSGLVVPDSQEENDFIWREMKKPMKEYGALNPQRIDLWIGCTDPNDKRDELLCSGTKGNSHYTNWAEDEPNGAASECVRMAERYDGKWGDTHCSSLHFVACEMRVSRRAYCLPSDADGRFTPQCLLNHHIKYMTTTGVHGCGQACWAEPQCHSFNLWQQADNIKICQLNNATRLEADVTRFKEVENCTFVEL